MSSFLSRLIGIGGDGRKATPRNRLTSTPNTAIALVRTVSIDIWRLIETVMMFVHKLKQNVWDFSPAGLQKVCILKTAFVPKSWPFSSVAFVSGARSIAASSNQFNRAEKFRLFTMKTFVVKIASLWIGSIFALCKQHWFATKRQVCMTDWNFWLVLYVYVTDFAFIFLSLTHVTCGLKAIFVNIFSTEVCLILSQQTWTGFLQSLSKKIATWIFKTKGGRGAGGG